MNPSATGLWIPVGFAVPRITEKALVAYIDGYGLYDFATGFRSAINRHIWFSDDGETLILGRVTHWQKLAVPCLAPDLEAATL